MPIVRTVLAVLLLALLVHPEGTDSAEKQKKPYVHYWMSVATQSMSMPGMSEEASGMEGMMGRMMGMPGYGPNRTIHLQLNSPQTLPPSPNATHDIPPGQKMGDTLPLLIPEKVKSERYEEYDEPEMEKPKARMLIYWGCGEEVRKGQPRVLDTETMSPVEFGKALRSRGPSRQYPPSPRKGWIYSDWPNKKSSLQVPKESSLQGSHVVRGNYTPDIKFSVGERHDFMAPVEFTSMKGGLSDSIRFQWKTIPTAIGYFAQAMAHNEKTGETIFWSSSELADIGFGLLDYLSPSDVQRFIKEKVVLDPKTTSCAIPKAIFKGAEGAMLQVIGYGDELNLVHPPKPKDPKAEWDPIWSVKLRNKTTAMTPLGQTEERETKRPSKKGRERSEEEAPAEQPQKQEKEESGDVKKSLDKIKGIFGF